MAAAPKRGSDDELFSYKNTMELTFSKKPRHLLSKKTDALLKNDVMSSSSSDSEEDCTWKKEDIILDDDDLDDEDDDDDEENFCKDDRITIKDSDESPVSPAPPVLKKAAGVARKKTSARYRALNNLKRVLNEDALATPPSAMPGSKNDELIVVDDSPVNREMKIKVKCHGIVQRYRIRQNDPFAHVINSIAKAEDTTGDRVMLYLGEKSIKQKDTPLTIRCSIADIFECVIVSEKQNDSATIDDDKEDKENKINIKIQTKESHSKEDFYVCKMSPLEEVVKQYCKKKGIKFEGVKIYFDGEELNLQDTPEGLDMENGDIIDLQHS